MREEFYENGDGDTTVCEEPKEEDERKKENQTPKEERWYKCTFEVSSESGLEGEKDKS